MSDDRPAPTSEGATRGNQIRREVLGDAYVDRALATADDFGAPLQAFVAEHCWGGVWARPGLDRKTRSLLNLVMLTALNRPHELRIHVRGAVNNGCTVDEIREALLHATVYCGVPAGVDAFRSAREELGELGLLG